MSAGVARLTEPSVLKSRRGKIEEGAQFDWKKTGGGINEIDRQSGQLKVIQHGTLGCCNFLPLRALRVK